MISVRRIALIKTFMGVTQFDRPPGWLQAPSANACAQRRRIDARENGLRTAKLTYALPKFVTSCGNALRTAVTACARRRCLSIWRNSRDPELSNDTVKRRRARWRERRRHPLDAHDLGHRQTAYRIFLRARTQDQAFESRGRASEPAAQTFGFANESSKLGDQGMNPGSHWLICELHL
jgi:hypothetical protein